MALHIIKVISSVICSIKATIKKTFQLIWNNYTTERQKLLPLHVTVGRSVAQTHVCEESPGNTEHHTS